MASVSTLNHLFISFRSYQVSCLSWGRSASSPTPTVVELVLLKLELGCDLGPTEETSLYRGWPREKFTAKITKFSWIYATTQVEHGW